ncbi:RagB/SusD family nutrient uptake outer membrane protein [Paraflavitalea pollutisoli]|uniref:RagB/SusD family nutrient uptake outer membrane protein n=1 Tax=Paraflavitalea pollutisoli TaxID=3034143 RepID=UPI0023EC5E69|nr:RagB/SusD family nutrient uptake outer membrane protein [Paraflavitalea sp. H1-2-19X]
MKRTMKSSIQTDNHRLRAAAGNQRPPRKTRRWLGAVLGALAITSLLGSCKKFMDIVPDNVATIDHAFRLRNEAEKYLFTLYSFMPRSGDGWYNPGMMGGDEIWLPEESETHWHPAFRIARGMQTKDAPLFDEWAGVRKGNNGTNDHRKLWIAISHCNIFMLNMRDMTKVPDISEAERMQWIGEAEFLKAFYHYYLFRMYGPVPIMDKNIDVDGDVASSYSQRAPVDSVVNYVSNLLDSAYEKLPVTILDENKDLGRITRPIALAVKAKLWLLAASPLFNGNTDYAGFTDTKGKALFNPAVDKSKWEKAKAATLAAITAAESNGHRLYEYGPDLLNLTDTTKLQLSIRNATTGRWNTEHVWANAQSYFVNESLCMPPMERLSRASASTIRFELQGVWAAPIKIAKLFYSKNGVPIEEDKTLNFRNIEELRTATQAERNYIEPGFTTSRLNYDREPRFYADLGFDGGVWYMKDAVAGGSDRNTYFVRAKNGERAGLGHFTNWNETGYFIKKLVHWESGTNQSTSWKAYPWPEIRLADLYLMYAEALNELEPGSATAIQYLDKIRTRAGLKGVVESWNNFSTTPGKYSSQDGLRAIIQQERLIELSFEGQRFWDLRRWKRALEELNKDITGWTSSGKTTETYYKERVVFTQRFLVPRDYLWPVGNYDIRRNPLLVENPGW